MSISDRDLIATVHNRYGNRTISRFDYTNDEIGRRVARVDSGEAFAETAFERYAYNDRSVIGAQRFYGSDIDDFSRPVTGRTFGYGYDPIGNRISSFEDAGGERLITTYTANELNQYSAIQNSAAVPLRGDAKRDAVVTVNGDRAERDNGTASFTPWSYALPSSNSNASFQHADILAVAQSATGEDIEQRESGSVFVPAAETLLEYDDDGNMTFDGRFRYTWNGENRMIRAEETIAPTNRAPTVITYAYDDQGRMVSKNIAGTNTIARSLLWDGYNIVRETDNDVPTYNIWGLDLDGTLQGCGGVGGLLSVVKTNGLHVAFYDANGNVSEYVSAPGFISAHYEHSPFGEPLVSLGGSFTHQFSTKTYCNSAEVNEYQLRAYHHRLGRWNSRDPFSEILDIQLYLTSRNNSIGNLDLFGLTTIGEVLDEFFSPFNTEEDLWIMDNHDLYTYVMESWTYVQEQKQAVRSSISSNPQKWQQEHTTTPSWKPSMGYFPDPRNGYEFLVQSPKGTDPETCKKAFIEYVLFGNQTFELFTGSVGSFTVVATVDSITLPCGDIKGEATANIWIYNSMSEKSFGKFAKMLIFRRLPMASQHMWWNIKDTFEFSADGLTYDKEPEGGENSWGD